MERDDEARGKGNQYQFGDYCYDPRLGRRFNIDPVVYAWQTGYAVFNNNPIYFIDPLGLEGETPRKATRLERKEFNRAYNNARSVGGKVVTYKSIFGNIRFAVEKLDVSKVIIQNGEGQFAGFIDVEVSLKKFNLLSTIANWGIVVTGRGTGNDASSIYDKEYIGSIDIGTLEMLNIVILKNKDDIPNASKEVLSEKNKDRSKVKDAIGEAVDESLKESEEPDSIFRTLFEVQEFGEGDTIFYNVVQEKKSATRGERPNKDNSRHQGTIRIGKKK
jgi:hypothetical protein